MHTHLTPFRAPRLLRCARHCVCLFALWACGSPSPHTGTKGGEEAAPGDDSAAPLDTAPSGGADTAALDDAALTALLVGTWQPVSMNDSGNERPLPDDPASYLLLDATGGVAFGCGSAPFGTWTATAEGAGSALGAIHVAFGATQLTWVVLAIDEEDLIFAEGGDSFTHTRGTCPEVPPAVR